MNLHPKYKHAPELWVITTYYNPCRYKTRRANYDAFEASLLRAGINLLTVECVFNGGEFELPHKPHVHRVRSKSVLWQKERLLNLAATWLPSSCKHVAWIDADVIFQNESWAVETVERLQSWPIVQLFETALRLERGNVAGAEPDRVKSFASVTPRNTSVFKEHRYDVHGHTGYAWAMRRDIFTDLGLYEHAVTGSADHYMAHAIYRDFGFCIKNTLRTPEQLQHFREWAERFHSLVHGRLGCVTGELVHLWHGSLENRRYWQRQLELSSLRYDPYHDVAAAPGQPFEWATDKPELHAFFHEYFQLRREDGEAQTQLIAA